ncbi:aspartate/glutamate racemase family protein [Bacillus nitroreducens]
MRKKIGIIGGMGPLATVDLMNKIIQCTPASKDQDHLHVIADNYPQIPDRTAAILGNGEDPLPFMQQSAKRLEAAGVDLIAIACNTAHYFWKGIQTAVSVPILHMPKETVAFIHHSGCKQVALFATDGTIATNLYQDELLKYGIQIKLPDKLTQAKIMEAIYSIKGGDLSKGKTLIMQAAQTMQENGTDAIIAACTEIPLVLSDKDGMNVIDPSQILAKTIVEVSLGNRVLHY